VVEELRERRPDKQITALANAEAEIDIVERHPQIAIEAPDLVEDSPAHGETGRSHSRQSPLERGAAKISGIVPLAAEMNMSSHAAYSQTYTPMLPQPIGVQKLRGPTAPTSEARGVGNQVS